MRVYSIQQTVIYRARIFLIYVLKLCTFEVVVSRWQLLITNHNHQLRIIFVNIFKSPTQDFVEETSHIELKMKIKILYFAQNFNK